MTILTRRIGLAAVLILALIAGIAYGVGSNDKSSFSNVDASSNPIDESRLDPSEAADSSTVSAEAADTPVGQNTDSGTPSGATTPAIGPVTLTSSLDCAATVATQVYVTVDGTQVADTGIPSQRSLDVGTPVVAMKGQSFAANAGTAHTVAISLQEHMEGFFTTRTETTSGKKSVVVPASNTHAEWTFSYDLELSDGAVNVSDVVLSVTGCQEIVVPQLMVSVVNGNGTVTTFLDTGSSDQLTLVSGTPLVISPGAESGIDPADINRIEVRLFEHMFGRELDVSAEDNGTFTVEVEKNGQTDGAWTLEFDVDGLV